MKFSFTDASGVQCECQITRPAQAGAKAVADQLTPAQWGAIIQAILAVLLNIFGPQPPSTHESNGKK